MAQRTLDEIFQEAALHHQADRLSVAEALYREILQQSPNHPSALYGLGIVHASRNERDTALSLISRSVELYPTPSTLAGLGAVLSQAGRVEEAVTAFERALSLDRSNPDARRLYAELRHRQAERLRTAGQIDGAIAGYRAAYELDPSRVESLNNLGNLFQERGLHAQAIAALRRAAQVRPDLPELQFNLGNMLAQAAQFEDATLAYQRAIQLNPGFAQAFNNLGNAFRARGLFAEARVAHECAGSLMPNFGEAAVNIGIARMRDGDLAGAIEQFRKAIALMPSAAEAYLNLGNALKESGQIDDALAAYRRALVLQPTSGVWDNLLYALHFHPTIGPAELFKEHAAWNRACVLRRLHATPRPVRDWNPNRPLRVGYVSADFREHPVGRFLLPLLSNHDRLRFQIYCYSDVRRETEVTQTIKSHATVWRNTVGLPDEKLAEMIAADQIDILVETSMHLEDNRMLALASKPAPVQVTYLAYCSTTGSQAIDYRLTDPYLDPSDADQPFYSEQSVRLRTYWCYVELIGAPPVSPLPSVKNGYTTFGCLNSFSKASKTARQAWCEILRKNPNSRLILHSHAGSHRDEILREFADQGINASRIEFVGFQPLLDYLATYNRIDIALDPFPYPGGTTSCDALWMGVPVITLAGTTAISRGGASVLATVGLPELIAGNTVHYVSMATRLAADLPRLQSLRAGLREQMRRSPLMDQPAFAKDVEQLYREMWRRHTANLHFERGNQCQERNDPAGAVEAYRGALAIRPQMAEAHNNLGTVLRALGQREPAAAEFATAVQINPNYVDALSNHAVALREDGNVDASIAACRHALSVNPHSIPPQITLGNALMLSGDLDGAIDCFRKVIAIDPHSQAYDNLLYAINFHPRYDARQIANELARWEQIVARPAMALGRTSHRNDRSPGRRLRVGFVSPDFRDHTIGRFLLALFEHHDPQQIEIAVYSEVTRPDWMTEALRRHASIWRDTRGVRDDVLANQIEADQIDILIDLAMHSDGSRLIAFTQRPAPVQATYLAYCGTTGLHSIDYRISDNFIDPPGADESVYVEKTVRLETFWCYVPPPGLPEPATRETGAPLTFGCLNNFSKINPDVLGCWAEILRRIDKSNLLIHSFEGAHRERVLNTFQTLGIDPTRIQFSGPQKFKDYFASYSRIDIALDPFPFGGGTTTCDALWMGVPVITLVGRTAAGRGGASVLNQINLPELVALQPADYVEIAINLAQNQQRRTWLRRNLRGIMSRSPLMDAPRFARSFESVCRTMWRRYCEQP